jgi:transketolase
MRPTIRLAALMQLPNLFVFTHDALGDGEDGPTHQPIEQLASLRAMPGLTVIRPGDANEVVEAYRVALPIHDRPVAMVLSRQVVPTLDRSRFAPAAGVAQGAYVLADAAAGGAPEIILIATGGELGLAVDAYDALTAKGVRARVVSMPSWDLFERQPPAYRDQVLPPQVTKRLAIEQGSAFGWERYIGAAGDIVCMHGYGASAPFKALQQEFGFTAERVMAAAEKLLGRG